MKRVAIIVAGGIGKRMDSQLPKQFLKIHNEIILIKTIRTFHAFDGDMDLVVGLPAREIPSWEKLCINEHFRIPHKVIAGGETRFQTVKNALQAITSPSIIAIHDGVRPLVSQRTIRQAFEKAEISGNAIPVADIHESIRRITDSENKAVPRAHYKIVQTPQVFHSDLLLHAYRQEYDPDFTDDASVVEKTGIKINTVKGNPENIKITTKKDLAVAETLLQFLEK
ncbi:MAG: 2-C-methyl-D-erythritol 4-phosphate cytidylyltransferase [Bacteroidales bacterium]